MPTKLKLILCTLVVLVIGIITTPQMINAEDLSPLFNEAPNYSFEEGVSEPVEWTRVNGVSCKDSNQTPHPERDWAINVAKSGEKSLSLKNIDWQITGGAPIPGSWISSSINIDFPSSEYYFWVWTKSDTTSKNLTATMWVCAFDSQGNQVRFSRGYPGWQPNDGSWVRKHVQLYPMGSDISSIKVGFSANCYTSWQPCNGNLWFDEVAVIPKSELVTLHTFEDLNHNGIQDTDEKNLYLWRLEIRNGYGCIPGPTTSAYSNLLGNFSIFQLPVGEYSASVESKLGWTHTTPPCENILIEPNKNYQINFGLAQETFPYFSQQDPAWEGQVYDHADSIGPFFCGTTLAQCGCATTSSAMLLKYYGVDKSPTGELTNPQTLDNWLKANNGYAFGALKWNSIAAYSVKANQTYSTQQKIKFSGYGAGNDLSALDTELAKDRPTILQEPGHFIISSNKQGEDYAIADPAWQNKTTLLAYNNSFQSMRRFEKTSTDLSAIYISSPAPNDLLITDSEGRKTGKDADGNAYSEIPNSYYALEPAFSNQSQVNPQNPPENEGVNTLVILTPDQQDFTLQTFSHEPAYSIEFSGYDEDGDITVQNFDQTSANHFNMEYSESNNHFEFFQTVEIDTRHAAKSNPFNPNAKILPVSILASSDFDPQTVDINTIDTGPNWNLLKTSTILIGPRLQDEKSLLLLFENSGNYEEEICIRGKTLSGTPFRGCDSITTVGNGP